MQRGEQTLGFREPHTQLGKLVERLGLDPVDLASTTARGDRFDKCPKLGNLLFKHDLEHPRLGQVRNVRRPRLGCSGNR